MTDSRIKNSIRNSIWGVLQSCTVIICPFIMRTIILWKLGEQYLGLSSLFNSVFAVFNLAEAGFGTAIVYFMYRPVAEGDVTELSALLAFYRRIYHRIGLIILGMALVAMPFLPYMSKNGYPDNVNMYVLYIIYLGNSVLPYFSFEYKTSLFTAYQRSDYRIKIYSLCAIIAYLLQAVVLVVWNNYYLYTGMFILQAVTYMVLIEQKTRTLYPEVIPQGSISRDKEAVIYKKVKALIGNQIDKTVLESSDNIVISTVLGLNFVGIYGNYMYICNAVLMFLDAAFFQAALGSVGNSIAVEDAEANYGKFRETVFLNNVITGFCAACIMVLIQHFMTIWAGDKMLLPISSQILFVIYFYIFSLRKNIALFKNARGMWTEDKLRPYISIAINILLDIILVPTMGINGALLATVFCVSLIELPWETAVLHKYYFGKSMSGYWISICGGVAVNIIFSIGLYRLLMLVTDTTSLTLMLKVLICVMCGLLYYGLLYFKRWQKWLLYLRG